MRQKNAGRHALIALLVVAVACTEPGSSSTSALSGSTTGSATSGNVDPLVETVKAFEAALWSGGDVDAALAFVSRDFVYRYPHEVLAGADAIRSAFGSSEGHGTSEVRLASSDYVTEGNIVSWTSIRYFPGSIGQASALTATFDGDLIAEGSETGARTLAEDAIGCENEFPYAWHADYEQDAVGTSADPVEAAIDAFPGAIEGLTFSEADLDTEAPMSGGQGPIVRAVHGGYSVGFVFLTARSDGSLLVDGVTACEGFLEPAFEDEEVFEGDHHGDVEPGVEGHADEFLDLAVDESGAAATAGTPLPDVEGAVLGDDGEGPLPLGAVTTLPDSVRLDFLFEFCTGEVCWRDAHFMDPDNPGMGSGGFTAGMPFHVRHGFVNDGEEPLGEGFDVVVYVTEIDEVGEFGGGAVGETFRYTSDYVIRGEAETCGPSYRTQTGPVTCEWFVHEFEDGLPVGRHALGVMWEAPCSAWVDYGFTESCADPDQTLTLFTSGVDSAFSTLPPTYDETSNR